MCKLCIASRVLLFHLLIMTLICCGQGADESEQNLYELFDTGEIVTFPLDSLTSPFVHACQMVKQSEQTYLTFLNDITNSIYWYDLNNQQLHKIQHFTEEGQNGTQDIVGYHYITSDTVILVSRNNYKIRFADSRSEIFRTIDLAIMDGEICFPQAGFGLEIILQEDKLFIICAHDFANNEGNIPPKNLVTIDLKTKAITYLLEYPEIYRNKEISAYYLRAYQTHNPNTGMFVYSFPLSEYVIETDHEGYVQKHFAKSSFFSSDEWNVKGRIENDRKAGSKALQRKYLETPTYGKITFDPYRNLYYRITKIPQKEKRTKEGYPINYESVIILDEYFNKLSEQYLDINTKSSPNFFTSDALYFHTYPESESLLTFRKLTLKKRNSPR